MVVAISDPPTVDPNGVTSSSEAILGLNDATLHVALHHFTPDEAAELLGTSVNYRSTTKKTVAKYRRDMENGQWRLSGEAVTTDRNGDLVNGFHRMEAAASTTTGFMSLWVKGVTGADVEVMDSGRPRTLADVLRREDVVHAGVVQAAITWEWRYRQGVLVSQALLPTREELLSLYRADPTGLADSAIVAARYRRALPGSAAPIAAIYHIALDVATKSEEADSADIVEFFERTRAGVDLSANDPSHLLREWLASKYKHTTSQPPSLHTSAVTIKAMNLWLRGETLNQLKYSRGGRNKETFPVIGDGWA